MSYIKELPYPYMGEEDVKRVVRYISEIDKSKYLVGGGIGIINAEDIHGSPEFIADQILAVQRYKGCRGKRLYHIVVSFDRVLDEVSIAAIKRIADRIVWLYRDYQSVYALHEDTRNLHLHILFNNIPLGDRKNLTYDFNIMNIRRIVDEMIDGYKYSKRR